MIKLKHNYNQCVCGRGAARADAGVFREQAVAPATIVGIIGLWPDWRFPEEWDSLGEGSFFFASIVSLVFSPPPPASLPDLDRVRLRVSLSEPAAAKQIHSLASPFQSSHTADVVVVNNKK